MKCWDCGDKDAQAACAFCGRFTCKDCAIEMSSFLTMYLGANNTPKGLAVGKVIWCGICEPQPEPIPMPELY